jgi:hypothetical protein
MPVNNVEATAECNPTLLPHPCECVSYQPILPEN